MQLWFAASAAFVLADAAAQTGYLATATCASSRGVHDGDTFACVAEGAQGEAFVVRVAGIDAPEAGQVYWRVARDALRRLAGDGTTVTCFKVDRHGRRVCRVATRDGADVAEALLRAGLAWYDQHYASEQTAEERHTYAIAQAAAQAARRGLWADPEPMAPWDCRQRRRTGQRCRCQPKSRRKRPPWQQSSADEHVSTAGAFARVVGLTSDRYSLRHYAAGGR